jgi:glutaconate CoA-transferase subunit A
MADPAGTGTLFTDPDPEAARRFFRTKKGALVDKVMPVAEAVAALIHDGDYIACGGFGTNRISTAVLHEILRQGRRDLGFAGVGSSWRGWTPPISSGWRPAGCPPTPAA